VSLVNSEGAAVDIEVSKRRGLALEIALVLLSIYAIAAVTIEFLFTLTPEMSRVFELIDLAVCAIFLGDFAARLIRAPDRLAYLKSGGWIDLVSSIPLIEPLRLARVIRILRIIRILRLFRSTGHLLKFTFGKRLDGVLESVGVLLVLVIALASVAIINIEPAAGGNIRTAEDAIWWSWVTVTTVGYGDHYPTTLEGRLVGMMLMTIGIGSFGLVAASIVTKLAKRPHEASSDDKTLADLTAEVTKLRAAVERLEAQIARRDSGEDQ
jgi:voltage-gated potassium channel